MNPMMSMNADLLAGSTFANAGIMQRMMVLNSMGGMNGYGRMMPMSTAPVTAAATVAAPATVFSGFNGFNSFAPVAAPVAPDLYALLFGSDDDEDDDTVLEAYFRRQFAPPAPVVNPQEEFLRALLDSDRKGKNSDSELIELLLLSGGGFGGLGGLF
jgi:hypothetical protein